MSGLIERRSAVGSSDGQNETAPSCPAVRIAAAGTRTSRDDWADVARGIGITFVVFEHAARGIVSAGIAPYSDAFKLQDAAIYSFHMPLFFFLSGCFFSRGANLAEFARTRIVHMAYPYFLWSLLLGAASIAASEFVNNPLSLSALAKLFVHPVQQFWFLYALFVCHWAGYIARPLWALLAVGIGLYVATAFTGVGNIFLTSAHYLIYFAIGASGAMVWRRASSISPLTGGMVGAAAAAAAALVFAVQTTPNDLSSFPAMVRFLVAALGIAAALGLSVALQNKAPLLSALGRASMAIYVTHTAFSAATRIALQHSGMVDPLLHNVVGTLVGLAVPYCLFILAKRAGATTLLGLGR